VDNKELIRWIGELSRDNERLRLTLRNLAPRATVATSPAFMSGRWHRRSGDIYGINNQSIEVVDANCPPGNL
jgi:hypothetical protein